MALKIVHVHLKMISEPYACRTQMFAATTAENPDAEAKGLWTRILAAATSGESLTSSLNRGFLISQQSWPLWE